MKAPKTTQLTPIILWTNENAIHEMEVKLNGLLELAEKLAAEYFKLPYAKPEATIGHILTQSRNEAKTHHLSLIPDSIEMGSLRMNKEAAIKSGLFAEPSYPEFEQIFNICRETDLDQMSPFFQIVDGKCILNPSTWDLFVKTHSIVASTPEELEMYQLWRDFLDAAVALDKFFRKNVDLVVLAEGVAPIQLSRLALPLTGGGLAINHTVFQALSKRLSINPIKNKSNEPNN